MSIPAESLDAAKEAMREVTPPPGVSKADWLAEHGSWALFAGAIAAAAPAIAAQALTDAANDIPTQLLAKTHAEHYPAWLRARAKELGAEPPAAPPASATEAQPVELGYLCHHGHFVFHDDPDVDYACGTKRIAGIIIQPIEGAYRVMFDEAVEEARADFRLAIGRAYK